jgi:Planctomycete cytochrome C
MRKIFFCTLLSGFLFSSALRAQDKVDFEKQIYPLIKGSCVTCHRPAYDETKDGRTRTKRPKGGIIFSTKEGILTAKGENDALVLVPGDPDKSRMLQVTLLPIDDEMHFPPKDKAPQWTKADQELFAKWVKAGADFGAWTADAAPNDGLEWDGKEKP